MLFKISRYHQTPRRILVHQCLTQQHHQLSPQCPPFHHVFMSCQRRYCSSQEEVVFDEELEPLDSLHEDSEKEDISVKNSNEKQAYPSYCMYRPNKETSYGGAINLMFDTSKNVLYLSGAKQKVRHMLFHTN
eukprot:TRINITY_DN13702_c0_g1_i2.p1 TRINITY_DN13702_c0_g1~~TRINITY_DN13702_c0_g1_i2.p1  ORF type:complete len:132 (-),score=10.28 TRINITY_DN13702_c0_g1_i2:465-860(-)